MLPHPFIQSQENNEFIIKIQSETVKQKFKFYNFRTFFEYKNKENRKKKLN